MTAREAAFGLFSAEVPPIAASAGVARVAPPGSERCGR